MVSSFKLLSFFKRGISTDEGVLVIWLCFFFLYISASASSSLYLGFCFFSLYFGFCFFMIFRLLLLLLSIWFCFCFFSIISVWGPFPPHFFFFFLALYILVRFNRIILVVLQHLITFFNSCFQILFSKYKIDFPLQVFYLLFCFRKWYFKWLDKHFLWDL